MKLNKKRLKNIRKEPEAVDVPVPANMPNSPLEAIPVKDDPDALRLIIKRTIKLRDNDPTKDKKKRKQWVAWCNVEIAAHQYHLDRLDKL